MLWTFKEPFKGKQWLNSWDQWEWAKNAMFTRNWKIFGGAGVTHDDDDDDGDQYKCHKRLPSIWMMSLARQLRQKLGYWICSWSHSCDAWQSVQPMTIHLCYPFMLEALANAQKYVQTWLSIFLTKLIGINGIHLSTKTFPKCQEKLEKQHVQSAETQEAKDMHHNMFGLGNAFSSHAYALMYEKRVQGRMTWEL